MIGFDFLLEILNNLYKEPIIKIRAVKDETKIKKSIIKKLSKTKYRVLLGPFNDIKKLEKSFNEIKVLNFENIEILKDV